MYGEHTHYFLLVFSLRNKRGEENSLNRLWTSSQTSCKDPPDAMQIFVKTVRFPASWSSLLCARLCLVSFYIDFARSSPIAFSSVARASGERDVARVDYWKQTLRVVQNGKSSPKNTLREMDATRLRVDRGYLFSICALWRRFKPSFDAFASFSARHIGAPIPDFSFHFLLLLDLCTHIPLFSFYSSLARLSPSRSSLRTPSTMSRRKSKIKRASRRISSD